MSYSGATVGLPKPVLTRRCRFTIAIVALSMFVALIAGSSLRPQFAAAELPEPAAWTHVTPGVPAHAGQTQLDSAAQPISLLSHSFSSGPTPTNKKPFRSMWMTKGRPTGWILSSPRSGWLALPASFAASHFEPGGADLKASDAAASGRDSLAQLCVIRC
ncbi:hypothetical protein B8W69_29305 [Mycobacterium vulneris]|uniref:Uncharacterized protein n=1 Tax=Mycolicibacterium vulneris TaxID=547163 RepID=A0A1X2KGW5_9MYCO|nr:hypothetical protein B8W69_29305 [Mycolicibacterium vulneris]